MMTWNYRILKHTPQPDITYYAVHECYYTDDGSDNGYTEMPVWATGETIEELRSDLTRMLQALHRPVISVSENS
jgi:hypothetical protein